MTSMASLFAQADHDAFAFPAEGEHIAGALLIHGFMGTPKELRPLGQALASEGIAVHAPLLPGFGSKIDTLAEQRWQTWVDCARTAWTTVAAGRDVSILIGFSMGAAVAIQLAAETPPAKLVLMAPFQRIVDRRAFLIPLGSLVLPEIKPFEHADFTDESLRDTFRHIDPSLNLDDPATQARLQSEYAIPMPALRQLQQIGKLATSRAPDVLAETLVIQGLQDDTVLPEETRDLITLLGGPVQLLEVDAGHQLVRDNRPAWPAVRDAVVSFATTPGGR